MTMTNYPNGIMSAGMPFGMMGVGNVYNVVDGDEAFYNDFHRNRRTTYSDGSVNLHKTIASALAATVECRNDYVVVWPKNSDHDITAALAMDKKAVHLVCPSGMGYDMGSNNSCRIEQTTSSTSVFTITDAAVEIAGFYLKPYTGVATISGTAGCYAANVHHNYFVLRGSVSSGASILTTTTAFAWGSIMRNKFESQVSSATFGSIVTIQPAATGTEVSYNHVSVGNQSTATIGIENSAVLGNTNFNVFSECGTSSTTNGGTITACVSIHASSCAIGNRCAVASGGFSAGGTAGSSFCDNLDGRTTSGTDVWNLES